MTNLAHEAWFNDPALKRVFSLLNADGGEGAWWVAPCATA